MNNPFNEERIRMLRSKTFDQLSAMTCDDFTVSEIEYLIAETPMRDEEKRWCVAYYIKRLTHAEMIDYGLELENSKKVKKKMHEKMISTLIKVFFTYS